jgi:GH24 family phage-related lysozyme (muramidase)
MAGELKLLNETLEKECLEEKMSLLSVIGGAGLVLGSLFTKVEAPKDLAQRIVHHEGYEESAYKDTKGKVTIGIGFNLDANKSLAKRYFNSQGLNFDEVYKGNVKLSKDHIEDLFELSMGEVKKMAKSWIPSFQKHPSDVQEVIIEMTYQMGNRVKQFKKTKILIEAKDYKGASIEMMDSKWGREFRTRATVLSKNMAKAK